MKSFLSFVLIFTLFSCTRKAPLQSSKEHKLVFYELAQTCDEAGDRQHVDQSMSDLDLLGYPR
jgi:hypothetical protein